MENAKILIAESKLNSAKDLKKKLSAEGFKIKVIDQHKNLIGTIKKIKPDVILFELLTEKTQGFELVNYLNKEKDTALIPVIFMGTEDIFKVIKSNFKIGEHDYIIMPFETEELIIRIEAILTKKRFYENNMTDDFTGFYNRIYYNKQLRILYNLARKYKRAFSLAVVRLDNLDKVNSKFGSEACEIMIKNTASIISDSVRTMDISVRTGENEFVVILPETTGEHARLFLDKLKMNVDMSNYAYNDAIMIPDVSYGSATCVAGEVPPEKMLELANLNIYVEKNRQRKQPQRRVVIIEDEAGIANGVRLDLETEGFSTDEILYTYDSAIFYIRESSFSEEPDFVILDLDLCGYFSADFLGLLYSKWKNTKVYIFTAYMEYLEKYPYLRDIVSGVFSKAEFRELVRTMKAAV